jgi:two-component system, NtrC family, response regulator AtoC
MPAAANQNSGDPGTLPLAETDSKGLLALYVSGPHDGARHLLPAAGLVTLGRSDDCTIVLADPSASRSHLAIELSATVTVSDLGSANGTRLGRERLAPREPHLLDPGQTVFVGDTALVIRPTGLRPAPVERRVSGDELVATLSRLIGADGTGGGVMLLSVRAQRAADAPWLEAILGDLLPADGVLARLGSAHAAIAMAASAAGPAPSVERVVAERMWRWGIGADVMSLFVDGTLPRPLESALEMLRGGTLVRLRRGAVIVRDPAMVELQRTATRLAPTDVTVLVLGETGVGKDVAASMLHELSPRAPKPLLRLNCASLPETLLESELFGHERGAFTDAVRSKAGLLEAADGGTVFLDEIGELPPSLQAKLLQVIESRLVTRLGGLQPRAIDVRFVAATNRDLAGEVEAGRFRRDLFYRLNTVTLRVPPLRDRPSEIEPLALQFLEDAVLRFGLRPRRLSRAALSALCAHSWPGNVRELRNVLERAAVMAEDAIIHPNDLGLEPVTGVRADLAPAFEADERARIEQALLRCAGNQTRAAAMLGIPRRTLVRKIARLGLRRPHR